MKKALVVVSGLYLLTVSLWAQTAETKFSFQLGAGLAFPSGDLADGWSSGIGFGATFNLHLKKGFCLFADIRHSGFPLNKEDWGYPQNATIDGGRFAVTSIFLGAKYVHDVSAAFSLYGLAGSGLGIVSVSDLTARYTITTPWYTATITETISFDSETKPGLVFGGGFIYSFGPRFGLFAEIRFVTIFTEGDSVTCFPALIGIIIKI